MRARSGVDQRDLAEAGWGVIFADGAHSAIRAALRPLLDHRHAQAARHNERRYRELVGPDGYRPDETKNQFITRHGSAPGPVDPDRLPYYLLIVGDPETIPFSFQAQLGVQHAVGRIHFDTVEEYARYAASVVAAETGGGSLPRRAAFVGVRHPNDPTTDAGARLLVEPLAQRLRQQQSAWAVEAVIGPDATKEHLSRLLGGGETPALLFTAGHGVGFPSGDPRQPAEQGALLGADWPGPDRSPAGTRVSGDQYLGAANWPGLDRWPAGTPLAGDQYLAAADIAETARLHGLISFQVASFSAGTLRFRGLRGRDRADPQAWELAPRAFLAELPRRLLAHPAGGALACVGHVDQLVGAWAFGPEQARGLLLAYETALLRLLDGDPVGAALEALTDQYAEAATDLNDELEAISFGKTYDPATLAGLWATVNDLRSLAILGDPAVRLVPTRGADDQHAARPEPEPVVTGADADADPVAAGVAAAGPAGRGDPMADLELRLRRDSDGVYVVDLAYTPPGGERTDFERGWFARLDPGELDGQILDPDAYGRLLTDRFLSEAGRPALVSALDRAEASDAALRVRLVLAANAEAFQRVRWELLRDPRTDRPLVVGERCVFSRYLSTRVMRAVGPRPLTRLRALVVVASPAGIESFRLGDRVRLPLDVEGELQRARAALGDLEVVELAHGRATLAHLINTLQAGFDVLYLVGHAALLDGEPRIWLEDADGRADILTGRELAEAFSRLRRPPSLVVLLAPGSGWDEILPQTGGDALAAMAPHLAAAGVAAILAMQGIAKTEMLDRLLPAFFDELWRDGRADRALAAARARIGDYPDWWMPVLLSRERSGRLWYRPTTDPPTARIATLPSPPAAFAGRRAEVEALVADAGAGAGLRRVSLIRGPAGVGKTALALVVAHRIAPHYPDAALYLDLRGSADTPRDVRDAKVEIIRTLDPAASIPTDAAELNDLYQVTLGSRRGLLLLDDASGSIWVSPFLPAGAWAVLITSRHRADAHSLPLPLPLVLDGLSPDDARELLQRLAPHLGDEEAQSLAGLCDYRPLALRRAAGLLADRPDLAPAEFLRALQVEEDRLRLLDQVVISNPTLPTIQEALTPTYGRLADYLQASWRLLCTMSDAFDAEDAARLWGLLPVVDPSYEEEAEDRVYEATDMLDALEDEGLVVAVSGGRYRVPTLERLFGARLLTPEEAAHARRFLGAPATDAEGAGDADRAIRVPTYSWYLLLDGPAARDALVGDEHELTLRFSPTARPGSVLLRIPATSLELAVFVEARAFARADDRRRTIQVVDGSPVRGDREVVIRLVPLASGTHRVRVVVAPGGSVAGVEPVELPPYEVRVATPDVLPDSAELIDRRRIPEPRPDVVLYVMLVPGQRGEALRYYLTCPALDLDRAWLEPDLPLDADDLDALREAVTAALAALVGAAPADVLAGLRSVGSLLFDQLMPPRHPLRERYRRILELSSGATWTWLIVADERAGLPWELLCRYGRLEGSNRVGYDEPLAGRFVVAHWVGRQGLTLANEVPLDRLALSHYDQRRHALGQWRGVLGGEERVEIAEGAGQHALTEPGSRCYGLHVLRYAERARTGQIAEYDADDGASPPLRSGGDALVGTRHLDYTLRRPLVGLSFVDDAALRSAAALDGRATDLESGWAVPLLHAGATALVGPRWPVRPEADRRFFGAFYEAIRAGVAVGAAVFQARDAVRRGLPDGADWAAYAYFGHPACSPYPVRSAQGFTIFEAVDHPDDEPFVAGQRYDFRASYRIEPPAWYPGRLRASEVLQESEELSVSVAPLTYDEPETRPLVALGGGDYACIVTLEMPARTTRLPVMVLFQRGSRDLSTLMLRLDVVEG